MERTLHIGTRGSRLALTQANWVADRLRPACPDVAVEVVVVKTTGDLVQDRPLSEIGVGVFTKELDRALLEGRVDAVVHSLKDVPTAPVDGICLAAVPEREDARDAFFGRKGRRLGDLREGDEVGTGSLRRVAQLSMLRPDLRATPMRGNIDTRLAKLEASQTLGGIILALAGVRRLGLDGAVTEILDVDAWLPAPGQGALGIAARDEDEESHAILSGLDDAATHLAVTAERAVLARLGGGCHVPVGAFAHLGDGVLSLDALIADTSGARVVRHQAQGDPADAEALGVDVAEALLAAGGDAILGALATDGEAD